MSTQSAQLGYLKNKLQQYQSVLDQARFFSFEIDAPKAERQSAIETLKSAGAIRSRGMMKPDDVHGYDVSEDDERQKAVHYWEWVDHRDALQDYAEDRNELPCGCRSHIPPEQDGETYFCKFCGDGHDRETIQEAL